jgi:hypothetical protein
VGGARQGTRARSSAGWSRGGARLPASGAPGARGAGLRGPRDPDASGSREKIDLEKSNGGEEIKVEGWGPPPYFLPGRHVASSGGVGRPFASISVYFNFRRTFRNIYVTTSSTPRV